MVDTEDRDLETQDTKVYKWEDYTVWLQCLLFEHSVGVEILQVFFQVQELNDTSPKFPHFAIGLLRTISWIIAPLVLEIYIENETSTSLAYGYGVLFLASGAGLVLAGLVYLAACYYAGFAQELLDSDQAKSSLGIKLFLLMTTVGISWSIIAAVVSLFDSKWLAGMCLFIVFFVLRVASSCVLSTCKSTTFPYVWCGIKWLVDGAVGVLGGFIFYLIMSSSEFIIEKTEIPTLRNACLILGGLHSPLFMPLLPVLAPHLFSYPS